MQAVVLAGGKGTRMRPATLTVPKFLLPVCGKPFAAWLLDRLRYWGFNDVVICTGYLGEQIEGYVGDGSRFGVSVWYCNDGPEPLGTGGALREALPLLEPMFIVTYGDSYLFTDYASPLLALERMPRFGGIMLKHNDEDYGITALRRGAVAKSTGKTLNDIQREMGSALFVREAPVRWNEIGSPEGLADLERHLGGES